MFLKAGPVNACLTYERNKSNPLCMVWISHCPQICAQSKPRLTINPNACTMHSNYRPCLHKSCSIFVGHPSLCCKMLKAVLLDNKFGESFVKKKTLKFRNWFYYYVNLKWMRTMCSLRRKFMKKVLKVNCFDTDIVWKDCVLGQGDPLLI